MQRYFIQNEAINRKKVVIKGDDYHHIRNVMRMRPQDQVTVCDEDGNVHLAEIEEITATEVRLKMLERLECASELEAKVTVAMGLTRREKQEEVLRRVTELGASGFLTVSMERSVVKAKENSSVLERQKKIAKEAAEQSQRSRIPDVHGNFTFAGFLDFAERFEIKIFAYEEEAKKNDGTLRRILKTARGKSAIVLTGPEGGISSKEAELLKSRGFVPVGLGPRILRCETAPLYVMSAFGYELESENES